MGLRGPKPGSERVGGRQKGTPNKLPGQVKQMILAALDAVGGVEYLSAQAKENPTAFMTLVGKVLPLQVSNDPDNPIPGVTLVNAISAEVSDLLEQSSESVSLH